MNPKEYKKYKILVRNLNNIVLTFFVNYYEIKDGFVVFEDPLTLQKQMFAVSNCEIKQVLQ